MMGCGKHPRKKSLGVVYTSPTIIKVISYEITSLFTTLMALGNEDHDLGSPVGTHLLSQKQFNKQGAPAQN